MYAYGAISGSIYFPPSHNIISTTYHNEGGEGTEGYERERVVRGDPEQRGAVREALVVGARAVRHAVAPQRRRDARVQRLAAVRALARQREHAAVRARVSGSEKHYLKELMYVMVMNIEYMVLAAWKFTFVVVLSNCHKKLRDFLDILIQILYP